jgi:outer membrane lipoprotein LolB
VILYAKYAKLIIIFALIIIAGCANNPRLQDQNNLEEALANKKFEDQTEFRGRLALRIDAQTPQDSSQPQSFSGGFELSGTAQTGTLLLFSPLGSTLAALNWRPGVAQMRNNGTVREFESLGAMVQSATGADLPIASLFSWLQGKANDAPGWSADLSRRADGRITARRANPNPPLELRVILD